jgi:hypothetical protein
MSTFEVVLGIIAVPLFAAELIGMCACSFADVLRKVL